MNSSHNSFIHDLQIASPCKADWANMTGDERKRFCGMCKMNVFNISEMTLPEAEKFVQEAEGRVCIRMYRRADGTVITQDCPVGLAAKLKRRMQRSFAYAAAVSGLLIAWAVNWRVEGQPTLLERLQGLNQQHTFQPTMGEMVASPPKAEMGKMVNPSACKDPPTLQPVVEKEGHGATH